METLIPQTFLHVADKFYPRFIDKDREVKLGATHLYIFLFSSCYHTGECSFSMETLADVCKGSERAARTYINTLVRYGYIAVSRNRAFGGCNSYRLLKSPRLLSLLERLGYNIDSLFVPRHQQNLPLSSADSAAPSYKEDKREESNTPLSPLPKTSTSNVPPSRCISVPAQARACATGGACPPEISGRGDFLSRSEKAETPEGDSEKAGRKRSAVGTAGSAFLLANFERLWSVWSIKQGRLSAEKIFCSLARAGRLPGIDALLGVVERFQSCDSRWRRGYIPNLANWLQGERWNDEPFQRDDTSSGMQAVPLAPPMKALPPANRTPEERAKADKAGGVFDAFSALWPSENRGRICAALCRARARGLSPEKLLDRAKESLAGAMPPPTFEDWLEEVYA